jgi:superfamily II DNA or RNA helicase
VQNLSDVRAKFTARSRYDPEKAIPAYAEQGKWFGFPRHSIRSAELVAKEYKDKREIGDSINFEITSGWREGQAEFIGHFKDRVRLGATGLMVEAPTAAGKTVLALHMIKFIGATALVVVHRSNLVRQWVEEILAHTDLKESEVGTIIGGKADWRGKAIIVALVHSLATDKLGDRFKRYPGVAIFDEADRSVPPETFGPVLGMFPAKYRIMMSASMKRKDGLHKIIKLHAGETVLKGTPGKKMKNQVLVHRYRGSPGPDWWDTLDPKFRRAKILSALETDLDRCLLIAQYAKRFWMSEGRVCMVISERTALLYNVRGLLINSLGVPEKDIGYFTASVTHTVNKEKNGKIVQTKKSRTVKADEQDITARTCRIILSTFGMLEAGTNLPVLSGTIMATPRTNPAQVSGRSERIMEGKKPPLLVDIVDVTFEDAMRWFKGRESFYKKEKMKIKVLKRRS